MINIRPIRQGDDVAFCSLANNNKDRLLDYFPITLEKTESTDNARAAIAMYSVLAERNELHVLFIENAADQQLLGMVFLKNIDLKVGKCELAYFIDKSEEGKGHTSAAVKLALDKAFHELGLNKVYCRVDPQNAASNKVATKNKFKLEGVLKQEFRINDGSLIDLNYYGLLRSDLA